MFVFAYSLWQLNISVPKMPLPNAKFIHSAMEQNPSEQDSGCLLFVHYPACAWEDWAPGWTNHSTWNCLTRMFPTSTPGFLSPCAFLHSWGEPGTCPPPPAALCSMCMWMDASARQGKMDWSEQIGKPQSQAENHNNISQVVRYYFSFVAYWLTVKSKILVFKTRQLWWSFFK